VSKVPFELFLVDPPSAVWSVELIARFNNFISGINSGVSYYWNGGIYSLTLTKAILDAIVRSYTDGDLPNSGTVCRAGPQVGSIDPNFIPRSTQMLF
jgi:hypothetical protein